MPGNHVSQATDCAGPRWEAFLPLRQRTSGKYYECSSTGVPGGDAWGRSVSMAGVTVIVGTGAAVRSHSVSARLTRRGREGASQVQFSPGQPSRGLLLSLGSRSVKGAHRLRETVWRLQGGFWEGERRKALGNEAAAARAAGRGWALPLKPILFLSPSVCRSGGVLVEGQALLGAHWCSVSVPTGSCCSAVEDSGPQPRLPGSSPGAGSCRPAPGRTPEQPQMFVHQLVQAEQSNGWPRATLPSALPTWQQEPPPVLAVAVDSQANFNAG